MPRHFEIKVYHLEARLQLFERESQARSLHFQCVMATLSPVAHPIPRQSADVVVIDLSDDDNASPISVVPGIAPIPNGTAAVSSGNGDDDFDDDDSEEEDSVIGDIIEAAQHSDFEFDGTQAVRFNPYSTDTTRAQSDSEVCTEEEAQAYRKRVRQIGISPFIQETVSAGTISAKKLCTAFGIRLPAFMKGLPDEEYLRILGKAILREIRSREKLPQYNTFDDAVALLQKSKNIMVITGAGISTNLGVPDFRSKNTGFYDQMRKAGFDSPEDIFDVTTFDEDPGIFYTHAIETFPSGDVYSPTHAFIRLLQDQARLLTNYTQNIDNLEEVAGIKQEHLIQCHGSWGSATCRKCAYHVRISDIEPIIRQKNVPYCSNCIREIQNVGSSGKRKRASNGHRSKKSKRRSSDDSDDDHDSAFDIPSPGVMKPDITFFGEALPQKFFERVRLHDIDKVDMVIVIGTSMQVAPVSEIPRVLKPDVPQIYISRDVSPLDS